jgi:dienelactone hydrolase
MKPIELRMPDRSIAALHAAVLFILAGAAGCSGGGGDDLELFVPREIPERVWVKLKEERDSIGPIEGLEAEYEFHEHPNGLPYHLYVPPALSPGERYPLVMFLHGRGDLALDVHGGFPKGFWSLPRVQERHPHVLFLPRHRTEADNWTTDEYRSMVMEALDDLIADLNGDPELPDVDTARIYSTGFSLAGRGTWNYVRNFPERFAAACPLAGYDAGPQTEIEAMPIRHVPTWIFCGSDDEGVNGSRNSFRALKAARARDVRYHEFAGHGHVIDDFAWLTDGFVDWMFAQRRSAWVPPQPATEEPMNVIFLHHSTGGIVWDAGVKKWFKKYNRKYKTNYNVGERAFPAESPYGWNNYPYDYWNIWVKNAGDEPYQNEPTLEMLTPEYNVIVFKHCFPVGHIGPDTGSPDPESPEKRLENYFVQYEALKDKMHEFPDTRFLVWTCAALVESKTDEAEARRTRQFVDWVKNDWDEPGDNIFLWDFYALETEGGLYLRPEYARSSTDSHPHKKFAKKVAPLFAERIVEVIEGR